MTTQVVLTQENEQRIKSFKALLAINDISLTNKSDLINKSIEVLNTIIKSLDDDSLQQLTNLKKTF